MTEQRLFIKPILALFASVLLSGLLWPSVVRAGNYDPADCPEVDLRDQFGPIRFQDDIGWCYANSAADMLTFYYKSILNGEEASAAYVAVAFNESLNRSPLTEGGDMTQAFRASVKRGICPRSGELTVLETGPRLHFKEKLEQVMGLKDEFDEARYSPAMREVLKTHVEQLRQTHSAVFDVLTTHDLAVLLARSTDQTFPINLGDKFCEGKRVIPTRGEPLFGSASKERFPFFSLNLQPQIDVLLRQHKPVAIGYDSDFLTLPTWPDPVNIRPWNTEKSFFNAEGTVKGAHSSLIVGQHWNPKKLRCEYIVRNSWGSGCGYHNPDLQENCQEGNLFIDKTYLEKRIFDVQWIASPRAYTPKN